LLISVRIVDARRARLPLLPARAVQMQLLTMS
jgi:hypothetical protein